MESYGLSSVISQGNHSNEDILNLNRRIMSENQDILKQRQQDISKSSSNIGQDRGDQMKTLGEAVVGQIGSKGKDIEAIPKVLKTLPDIASRTMNATDKYVVGGLNTAVEGISRQVPKLFGETAMGDRQFQFGDLLKSDTELARGGDLGATMRLRNVGTTSQAFGDLGDFLKSNISVGKSIGQKAKYMGKLGVASTGLTIGLGVLDAYDDIESGKIDGKNSQEKVANISGMVSGGLEAVGTALDLTGAGAPVGVALNLLGGAVGLAGSVAEEVGERRQKRDDEASLSTLQKTPPKLQQLQAYSDLASTGAEVKS